MGKGLHLVAIALLGAGLGGVAVAAASPVDDELIAIESSWAQAFVKRDTAALGAILADDWRGQSEKGAVTKVKILDILKTDKDRTTSAVLHDVHPRVFGDMAVVQGLEDDKGVRNGKPYSETISWTDVFQKRNGKWMAVASENGPLKAKGAK